MASISWDIFVGVVRTKESEAFEKMFIVQFAPEQILNSNVAMIIDMEDDLL